MDKAALLAEIVEWGRRYQERQPDDIMCKDYAEAAGVDLSTARHRLERMVRDGLLTKVKVEHGYWVYRKP